MFDLFRSRAKIVRYMLGAVLMLVAISMVVTLIPGFGTDVSVSDQVVAEIGDEELSLLEVQRSIQLQIRGRSLPSEMAAIYVPQIINQLITEHALAYQAERMGFQVTQSDVATTIESFFPQLFEGGKFVGKELYAAYLAQQNLTIPEFERNLRRQLLMDKLRSMVLEGIVVSEVELEREFRLTNEKVRIEYVAISPDKYRSEVTVSPEEIQNYFTQNRSTFTIPEKRNLQVLVVDEAKVAASITVPEDELRRAYEAAKEQYRTPERVHVRHILLKTTDKPKEEVPEIRAKAEELLKQLKQGADFAELARKHSEDPGSATKGGDLDWVARGQTVAAFEQTAFSLKPKEISDVVATEYGFHILQVLEKQEARLRPFEEVRSELADERKRQFVYDRVQGLADQARAALVKNPLSAEQIARELNLELIRADRVGAGDPIPGIGVSRELEDAAFPLRRGEVTPVVQVQPTKLATAVVNQIFPSRPAELSEAEAEIRQRLIDQKLTQLVEQRAREALEKARALDGDLRKVAQTMGLEWKSTPEFPRNGAAEGLGSADYLEEAFAGRVGEVFGPVSVAERQFICKTVEKIPADMGEFPAERDSLQQQLKSRIARERIELFEEGLRNRLIDEGKVKIHQGVVNRLVANYTGR